jgi:two-component system cell cycle response regulator CtrA
MARGTEMLFKSIGAIIEQAETGEEALEILRTSEYDIVIVDLHLPDMPGNELVTKIRARRIDTPVVILTGMPCMQAKVSAFGAGVDDFISKPVDNAELVARVRAIVRRNLGHSHHLLRSGNVVLDQDARQVTVAGEDVALTRKEFALLELIMLRRGRVVSKTTIMDHLYGGIDEPLSRTVDVFLCYLRKKLARAGAPDLIKTVLGVGFTLNEQAATRRSPVQTADLAFVRASNPEHTPAGLTQ